MKGFQLVIAATTISLLVGCASITGTTNQSVSVQTREQAGKEVAGVACELSNSKGKWFITTPGSVGITRSNDDMQVLCTKAGYEPGRAAVVSATKGQMFGNILFGGGIGAVIDHNTGAAYEYPSFFQVVMGMFTKVEPPSSTSEQAASSPAQVPASPTASPPAESPRAAIQPVASIGKSQETSSLEEQLREIKRLSDAGLISQEIYLDRQRAILASPAASVPTQKNLYVVTPPR